ncbi:hypothetical protein RRU94_02495 [Domibacillus sp. DTU_2020_1001157_1_SI_ALB_TIR_016]|uniref:hypothetical protein n=1 Tax=Domibacillus sp. DTU_2020_1001157_1_SI_ALB_TIR_016 TaxID=3077789 RepID=UPI0028E86333|nr:hypothetical protein [Domibacillus sp. DTU_2020_1001157_1_SI_ALB_TIR_016]WNS78834.1 hypothetical protein RRU94_02495 [Domibacillus sp. DTU_2020_1001157_1_SI_ALB_TIR_016]
MKKMVMALFLTMILSACGSSEAGLKQVDLDTVENLLAGEENGFVLAVDEKDQGFEPYLEDVLEDKGVKVNYYYAYQPDGEEGKTSDKQVFDFDGLEKKNHLYYIEDGKVSDPLRLTSYEGTELTSQIENFIDVHQ